MNKIEILNEISDYELLDELDIWYSDSDGIFEIITNKYTDLDSLFDYIQNCEYNSHLPYIQFDGYGYIQSLSEEEVLSEVEEREEDIITKYLDVDDELDIDEELLEKYLDLDDAQYKHLVEDYFKNKNQER